MNRAECLPPLIRAALQFLIASRRSAYTLPCKPIIARLSIISTLKSGSATRASAQAAFASCRSRKIARASSAVTRISIDAAAAVQATYEQALAALGSA